MFTVEIPLNLVPYVAMLDAADAVCAATTGGVTVILLRKFAPAVIRLKV